MCMDRLAWGKMQNPVRGILHGSAALGSAVALTSLLRQASGNVAAVAGALTFALAMLAMYTVSPIYHSIPWGERWKARIQRLDHSMIFVMVAGTITPIAVASLDGVALVMSLSFTWLVAVIGILLKLLLPEAKTWLSVSLQMAMGWAALVLLPAIYARLGLKAVILIALGGLLYTVGMIIFITKRPRLFPRAFSYHELFHVMVIAASAAHFLVIFNHAIPAIA